MDAFYDPELIKRGYIELSSDKLVIKVKGISSVVYSEVSDIKEQVRARDEAGFNMKILSHASQLYTVSLLLNESPLIARELRPRRNRKQR